MLLLKRRIMVCTESKFVVNQSSFCQPLNILGFDKSNWYDTDSRQEKVMGELLKIKEYLAKGDIEELD